MIDVSCNYCGVDDAELVTTHDGFRVVRCRGCSLVYVHPRPTSEELLPMYAHYHARGGEDEASWDNMMDEVFHASAGMLKTIFGMPGRRRLLDVGCGFGSFVKIVRSQGWDGEGIDASPGTVAAAGRKGVPVRQETIESFEGPPSIYDAITMFYVLEHLPDPMGALRKVYDLLLPGGMLLVRVPHTTPIVRMLSPFGIGASLYDAPYHLYDFSPSVLGKMLRKAGFDEVRTFPGKPTRPSGFGPFVASVLFGETARALYAVSGGRLLLPGVSKTTIARKPA